MTARGEGAVVEREEERRKVHVCEDLLGDGGGAQWLCRRCVSSRAEERRLPVRVVGDSVEEGSRCEDCGVPNLSAEALAEAGTPYLLGDHGDDGGEPLGRVELLKVEFPLKVYAEVARRVVTFPDERSLLRWANKQFVAYEIGRL